MNHYPVTPGSLFLSSKLRVGATLGLLLLLTIPAHGQWLIQSFELKSGWNAVYLHVDATHETLDDLIGADPTNPIEEIWMWTPNPSAAQFITNPQTPSQPAYW